MKLKTFQERRKKCKRIKNIAIWVMLIAGLNLTGIVGCIEQEHITLTAGAVEALVTLIVIAVAFAVHQIAEYIVCYRDFGRYIETKK